MFIETADFPSLVRLQNEWQTVLDELHNLSNTYFIDWPERDIYSGKWTVFGLYKFGERVNEHCARCPRTTELIEAIPGLVTAGFSSLASCTHIAPHVGYTNQVLRCHLGLITPPDCGIKVAGETRTWYPGSCFVFDDTYLHEAWNKSDTARVVLLLDFKRDIQSEVTFPEAVTAY
jgi:aspartyl/asparaginyl beta-hydroxylase (cupin superfamily)